MSPFLKLLTIITLHIGLVTWNRVDGERILMISPIAGRSHWNFVRGILHALIDHGHHVTVFTPFPEGNGENYTEIDISNDVPSLVQLTMDDVHENFTRYADLIHAVHHFSRLTFMSTYKNKFVQDIVADPNPKFDVIIVEFVASEWVSYLAAELKLPLIYVTPPPLISYVEHSILGHYTNPAVVSHTFADHGVPRTFLQRLTNTALLVYTSCLLKYKSWSDGIMDPQPFDQVEPVKPSIVFSNSHYITDAPRPLAPNLIPVGGIHLGRPRKIPDDILEFIENSPHGVILFSLGSIIEMSSIPKHTQDVIIEVLGQGPQRVLFKYESDIKNVPKNMMVKNWLPQRDILMHPNVKLFISHCGISGVYESVDAGVPILGFPLIFDQERNLANLVDAGMAISIKLESTTKDEFSKAVLELVNNDNYTRNARIARERFRDRPMSPARTVDYWTRYVIRHKGAPHLKSHAINLTWYQYFLLDVIAFVLLVAYLVVNVTYKVSKILYKRFVAKGTSGAKYKSE